MPGGEIRTQQKKNGIDWTSIHKTNEWGRTFEYNSDGEWQDSHLFSSTDNPSSSLLGRSTSKSRSHAEGSDIQGYSGSELPDHTLQIGKTKQQVADPILPQANRPQTPVQSHCHNPRARDDMSYIQRKRKSEKNLSTESQDSFEIIEIREESDRSIPITPGGSPRTAKKATKTPLKGGSASVSSSSSSLSLSSSSSSSSLSANSRNSPSSRSGSENYNS